MTFTSFGFRQMRIVLIAFVAILTWVLAFVVAARPSRTMSRLGMRGSKRQQALLRRPVWATFEPLVRWMGVRVSGLLGSATHAKLDAQLTYAGDYLGLTADEYFGLIVLAAVAAGSIASAVAHMTGSGVALAAIPVCIGVGANLPYMVVDGARVERMCAINRGLPSAIDLMSLSVSAGLDFPGALAQVVDKAKANEALREELAYILQQLSLGRTRSQALREFGARVPIESVREFMQAIIQAEERGNPVAAVLEIQAVTARTRRSKLAEKAATDMRANMVLPTMMLIGVGLIIIAVPTGMMMDKFTGAPVGASK